MTRMITMVMTISTVISPPDSAKRFGLFGQRWRLVLVLLTACFWGGQASAHPADEFCVPGGGLDPALCRALAQMDTAEQPLEELVVGRTGLETARLYTVIGVRHILPGGLDHILFVVLLVLSGPGLRRLVWHLSAFTFAHAVTLGLAASGVIAPSPSWVEPLIATTIFLVAVEVLVRHGAPPWRSAAVFGFGLIHGMGFAGYFGTVGFPDGQFCPALIGFNVGVELGQGAVALATLGVLAMVSMIPGAGPGWRRRVIQAGAVIIGLVSLFWVVERLTAS